MKAGGKISGEDLTFALETNTSKNIISHLNICLPALHEKTNLLLVSGAVLSRRIRVRGAAIIISITITRRPTGLLIHPTISTLPTILTSLYSITWKKAE